MLHDVQYLTKTGGTMNLLLILSIPALIAFGIMAAVLTRETWVGGRAWKP